RTRGLVAVGRAEVDEVEPVAHERAHVVLPGERAEALDLLWPVLDGRPRARVVGEDLEALAPDGDAAPDGLADAARGRHVGADPHAAILTHGDQRRPRAQRDAGALRAEPLGQP